MNDQDQPARDGTGADQPGTHEPGFDDPAFDDPGHAWVRDLLADARVTTPAPGDVVARLDDTLAALHAERAGSGPEDPQEGRSASVVPLRRRLLPRLAAAAAAVIVLAAGGLAVSRWDNGGSTSSDSAAGGTADSAGKAASSSGPGLTSGEAPQALAGAALPRLTTTSFAADAAAVMRRVAAAGSPVAGSSGSPDSLQATPAVPGATPDGSGSGSATDQGQIAAKALQAPPVTTTPEGLRADRRPEAATCGGPAVTGAVTLPATLDGAPVALVFRPPTSAGQRVEAWSCDGSRVLASATVAP